MNAAETATTTGAVEMTAAIGVDDEAADADDDAMLDLIAAEMSAPDVSDAHLEFDDPEMAPESSYAVEPGFRPSPIELDGGRAHGSPRDRNGCDSRAPGRACTRRATAPTRAGATPLGSTLIADGLLRGQARQRTTRFAALAWRLSQAEKIALFS